MDRADVTVVCCYNDPKQYRKLTEDLTRQHYNYTLIGIDNCGKQYSSCAKALNAATAQVKTEYVIYSHQDIELPDADMLEKFVNYLLMTQKEDILGVAGAVEDNDRQAREHTCVLSKVRHGKEQVVAGEREYSGMTDCETVDECFFGGHTEFFLQHPFDEIICDNWHLYGVERCMYTRAKGNKVYVCDIPLIHTSTGTIGREYNKGFYRVAKCYAKADKKEGTMSLKWLRTVCGSSRTDLMHRLLFYWKREILIRLNRY